MRYQLRVHLVALFGCFFTAFFLFLGLYASYFYQDQIVEKLSKGWPEILQERLKFSAYSVSTAFYFADKAFIDQVVRLKKLYLEADNDPYPISDTAYPRITDEEVADGKIVKGESAYCTSRQRTVDRLHYFWDQTLSRRLGPNKNVNGARIVVYFDKTNSMCIYPAQKPRATIDTKTALERITNGVNKS